MPSMTPQEMTAGQVAKAVSNYRTMLEKHGPDFPSDAVQAVLGDPGFAEAQLQLLRARVEMRTGILTRDVLIDLSLVGMQAINATGRKQYANKAVVATMPHAQNTQAKIHFFNGGRYLPVGEVQAEVEKRGFKSLVDPHTLAAFNTANPEFADTHPNCTQWVGVDGKFCYEAVDRWNDERDVSVSRHDVAWDGSWWFAALGE